MPHEGVWKPAVEPMYRHDFDRFTVNIRLRRSDAKPVSMHDVADIREALEPALSAMSESGFEGRLDATLTLENKDGHEIEVGGPSYIDRPYVSAT